MTLVESADSDNLALPQGLLDLLVLKTLAIEPAFMWAIAERLQWLTREMLNVRQGSLYPALQRLKRNGLVAVRSGKSNHNRAVKFYTITEAGKAQLIQETAAWHKLTSIVDSVLTQKARVE